MRDSVKGKKHLFLLIVILTMFVASSLQVKAQRTFTRSKKQLPVSVYDANGFVANATMEYWMGTSDIVFRFYWGNYKNDNTHTYTKDYCYIFDVENSHVSLDENKHNENGRLWLTCFIDKPGWKNKYQVLVIDSQPDGTEHFYFKWSNNRRDFTASEYKYVLSKENVEKFIQFYCDITAKAKVARRGDIWGDGMFILK